ncbi:MAG: hypothetical protein IPN06_16330 [Burkholderiales bacterium]|nr:hypothetical protein [Burkholderiales bacterium]
MAHEVIVDVAGEVPAQALHQVKVKVKVKVSITSGRSDQSKLRFVINQGLIGHLCESA